MGRWAAVAFVACHACIGLAAGETSRAQRPWAHERSDIAPDPAVVYGSLANGMRYALLPNASPPGAVSMRLAFDFGSLDEADNERGLAHFIEHMAFNGSRDMPEGDMVRRLELDGMVLGPDVNATTDRKNTVYRLDLPGNASDDLDDALFLLRQIASELTFEPKAVDSERAVVLSELRQADTSAQRLAEQRNAFLLPGAHQTLRSPGGLAGTVAIASAQTLASLYARFYRPERATLIVVGDFDPGAMAEQLSSSFADWSGQGVAGQLNRPTYVPRARKPAALLLQNAGGGDSISVFSPRPYDDPLDSVAQRREADTLAIALGAMATRMSRIASAEDAPFRSAGFGYVSLLDAADSPVASAAILPGGWPKALRALEQEGRRALLYGFTPDEIRQQVDAMRSGRRNAAAAAATRTTPDLAQNLLQSAIDDEVFATPMSALTRFENEAPEFTPTAVNAVFRRYMKMQSPQFVLSTTLEQPGAEQGIVRTWSESGNVSVRPSVQVRNPTFAYTNFGKAGRVVTDSRIADLDVRTVVFANNVRLNVKRTAFQKNSVLVSLRVAGGEAVLPEQPAGLATLMSAFSAGGLERHSAGDLRTILSGHAVQAAFGLSSTAFGASYATTPEDLELQLQVAAALLVDPGYRADGERRWRESLALAGPRLKADPQALLATEGARMLAGGDIRVGYDDADSTVLRSFVELKAALEPFLDSSAIEIAIVGDIDEDTAIALVARTFGALPTRAATWTRYRALSSVTFRTSREPIVLNHSGESTHAIAALAWPVTIDPDADPDAVRTFSAMLTVMGLKMRDRIREQLGMSYSPSIEGLLSAIYPSWGYAMASAEVKPENVQDALQAFSEIADEMRSGQVSDEELARAVTPALEQLPAHASMNGYWLSLIAEAQFRPDRMRQAELSNVEAGLRKITTADIVAAARKWLTPPAQTVTIVPAAD